MKRDEVEVGGTYLAKVGSRSVEVRIERENPKGGWEAKSVATGKPIRGFARETLTMLERHAWPGNVSELEHAIERAVALASAELLLPDDFPVELREPGPRGLTLPRPQMTLEEVKSWYIERVLSETGGNKLRAAEILGVDRRTLYRNLGRAAQGEDA